MNAGKGRAASDSMSRSGTMQPGMDARSLLPVTERPAVQAGFAVPENTTEGPAPEKRCQDGSRWGPRAPGTGGTPEPGICPEH